MHFELLAELQKGKEQTEIQPAKLMYGHLTLHQGYKNLP